MSHQTPEHEALAEVLHLIAHWVSQTERGLADTGGLVWRLHQAGYPLPAEEDDK
ncbi:hypothetical protein [Nocardiopsis salina]|uniref:hypothetical protein n=1 Tax=Nocardiopsis salina TaxID=245836 RepID=UPI000348141A|nr:hypothetical protein [Nocardiopsis salina]